MKIEHMSDKIIRASEIGEYVYCRRAWWLSRVGRRASQNVAVRKRGTQYHEQHGDVVEKAGKAKAVALGLWALAFVVLIMGLLELL